MPIDNVLPRLDAVRQTGKGKWLARCPAHSDKTPSFSIVETTDGIVLLRCWAGCDNSDILQALDLTYGHLFPHPAHAHLLPIKRPFNALDVLQALSLEVTFAWHCATMLANGEALPDSDRQRLLICTSRFNAALGVLDAQ